MEWECTSRRGRALGPLEVRLCGPNEDWWDTCMSLTLLSPRQLMKSQQLMEIEQPLIQLQNTGFKPNRVAFHVQTAAALQEFISVERAISKKWGTWKVFRVEPLIINTSSLINNGLYIHKKLLIKFIF